MPSRTPAARTPPKVAGVADALEQLESRRRRSLAAKPRVAGRRGDLDLDAIP